MDTLFTTESHDDCLAQCTQPTLIHGFEVRGGTAKDFCESLVLQSDLRWRRCMQVFLACHGGTVVVSSEVDTAQTLEQRAALMRQINGNCWGRSSSSSVRTCVSDPYVLDAFASVPRHMLTPQVSLGLGLASR
jgi:hypothetical protein